MNSLLSFLTKALVEEAVEIIRPGIEQVIKDNNRVAVCIDVMIDGDHEDTSLWTGCIGNSDPTSWGAGKTYDVNAHAKALMALREQEPNHITLRSSPQNLQKGDFKYYGGEYRNRIAIGTSGLAEYQDYLVSAMLAAALEALCMREFEKSLLDKTSNFF
jgi:hypothetical protein